MQSGRRPTAIRPRPSQARRSALPLARSALGRLHLRAVRATRDRAARGASPGDSRGADRCAPGTWTPRRHRPAARVSRSGESAQGAPARSADAHVVPSRPPGRGAGRVPGCAAGARGPARNRAEPRATGTRAADSTSGSLAGAADAASPARSPPRRRASRPVDALPGRSSVGSGSSRRSKAGLEDALAGHGRLFMLVGEPGIGKSRLADEFASHAKQRGTNVLWGRCWVVGGASAYWPWVRAPALVRPDARPGGPAPLLDGLPTSPSSSPSSRTSDPDLPPRSLDPDSARFRLFESVADFVRSAARADPRARPG